MRREKDPVQTFLIFGLPFYFWLGGVGMVLVARYLIGIHLFPMGILAKTLLFLTSFLAGLIFSYLLYWSFIYLKKKNVTN